MGYNVFLYRKKLSETIHNVAADGIGSDAVSIAIERKERSRYARCTI